MILSGGERDRELLDAARSMLLSKEETPYVRAGLSPLDYARLAVAYVTALGPMRLEFGLPRINELFRHLWSFTDSPTTHPYYAALHLNIIESLVLALVHEDFALGAGARDWLDDNEFLIRRRVHRDYRYLANRL